MNRTLAAAASPSVIGGPWLAVTGASPSSRVNHLIDLFSGQRLPFQNGLRQPFDLISVTAHQRARAISQSTFVCFGVAFVGVAEILDHVRDLSAIVAISPHTFAKDLDLGFRTSHERHYPVDDRS
jgi:hypothetical protein